ncbi:unnamed protein product, partial [Mesorhabditis belari]|uniref:Pepsin inhibitor-3-like repeated domain-containing protein n=1 Tax=Mesorhabditis belari TaxID=2138241 RepID=A0AAF3EZ79_9BILA
MLRALIFLPLAFAQFGNTNLGGSVGCVVTKNKLFSSGNYIRDLSEPEVKTLIQYKKDLSVFRKKIADAFDNVENIENSPLKNSTIPPMPIRPSMPSFCIGADTTMYIFAGCSVQNYKVYIGKTFARNLDQKERGKLDKFIRQMKENESKAAKDQNSTPTALQKDLDLCMEL